MAKASVSIGSDKIQAREKPTHREQQLGRRNLLGAHVAHPDNPRLSEYQHRRRDLLGRIAGLPIVAVAVPVAASAAEAEDPHVAWHAEWRCHCDWWNTRDEEPPHPVWDRMSELHNLILNTPAATAAGMIAQIDVGLVFLGAEDVGHDPTLLVEERALRAVRATLAEKLAV